jgi:competence protein ComEA
VEAAKPDPALRQRITEQAAYFGIAPSDIPRGGKLAAEFSLGKLKGQPFKLVTRWQPVIGPGGRFYCTLLVKGDNLAEALVTHGLARIHGTKANWPDEPSSKTFQNKLKNRELMAREQRLGLWDDKAFPRIAPDGARAPARSPRKIQTGTVDINQAGPKDLQTLPGIGPKLAERIIAHRPYQTAEDLLKVPGIDTNRLERIRPLVRTTSEEK